MAQNFQRTLNRNITLLASPQELRENVTSRGGTTEAGIKSMLDNGLDQSIIKGVKAAFEKSIELGIRKN